MRLRELVSAWRARHQPAAAGASAPPSVRVACPTCAVQTLTADDLGFTHSAGVITGWFARCPSCDELLGKPADAALLSLLHSSGAHGLYDVAPTTTALAGDDRAVVSLRILLDDPGFLARLAVQETEAQADGSSQQPLR